MPIDEWRVTSDERRASYDTISTRSTRHSSSLKAIFPKDLFHGVFGRAANVAHRHGQRMKVLLFYQRLVFMSTSNFDHGTLVSWTGGLLNADFVTLLLYYLT